MPTAPAGWYADPREPARFRWFDGAAWTDRTAPSPSTHGAQAATLLPGGAPGPRGVGSHPGDPVHWIVPTGRTWQSVLAGYLGVVALFVWVLAPVSVAVGVWALVDAHRRGGRGRGRAAFAVVAGVVGAILGLYVLSL